MKLKVLVISMVVACLGFAGTASAGYYHLSLSLAQHETRILVEEACEELRDCVGFGVGRCWRNTDSNVSCNSGLFYETAYGEEECNRVIRWGTNSQGIVAFRGFQAAHCFLVE